MSEFEGFEKVQSNFFRMPNIWIDLSSEIKSLAELKVVQYIMRHTWGYSEFEDELKKITLDEFVHGRKRKNGTRIDKGTGLDKTSVVAGLKKALEHGYIEVEVDDSDKARITKRYRIKMRDDQANDCAVGNSPNVNPCSRKIPTSDVEISNIGCRNFQHRTEKDTLVKQQRNKEMTPAGRDVSSRMEDSVYSGFVKDETIEPKPDKTAEKFATRLANGLQAKNKIMRWPNIRNWINQFENWMLETEADPSRVERVLDWYIDNVHHCEENYIPQAYSVKTFCEQFVRIESAMKRLQKTVETNDAVLERVLARRKVYV